MGGSISYILRFCTSVSNNPRLSKYVNLPDILCPICFEKDVDGIVLPCQHRFHYKCIKKWKTFYKQKFYDCSTCPICRGKILKIWKTY